MKNLKIIDHPLVRHKLSCLRDETTTSKEFREYLTEISMLMGYEIFKELPLNEKIIKTPISSFKGDTINQKINLYPVLRAGQGMIEGFLKLVPSSKVGHIGVYRDGESLAPKKYLFKIPFDTSNKTINVLLDPIVATGGSLRLAISELRKKKIGNIVFVGILGYKKVVEEISSENSDIKFFFASLDNELNKKGYLIPGMGDAGDRIYGTK